MFGETNAMTSYYIGWGCPAGGGVFGFGKVDGSFIKTLHFIDIGLHRDY